MIIECKDRHTGILTLENKLQEVFPGIQVNFAGTVLSSIDQELLETMTGVNNREYFLHYLDGVFKWVGKLDK
jgi:hypothetical protein